MAIAHDVRQAEVCYLDVHLGVQQQVLRLQVAVHHHVAMAVLHPGDDLLVEVTRLVLVQPPLLHYVVKQLSSLSASIRLPLHKQSWVQLLIWWAHCRAKVCQ